MNSSKKNSLVAGVMNGLGFLHRQKSIISHFYRRNAEMCDFRILLSVKLANLKTEVNYVF